MTDAELRRAVAVEVMGLRQVPSPYYKGQTAWEDEAGNGEHIDCPISPTWNDAGRVIEKMIARGKSFKLCSDNLGHSAAFTGGKAFDSSGPRAVLLAALEAVRARDEE